MLCWSQVCIPMVLAAVGGKHVVDNGAIPEVCLILSMENGECIAEKGGMMLVRI